MSEDDKDKILDQENSQNESDTSQSQDEKPAVEDVENNKDNYQNNKNETLDNNQIQNTEPEVVKEDINLFEQNKKNDNNQEVNQTTSNLNDQTTQNFNDQQNQNIETSSSQENNGKNKVIHKKDGRLHIYVRQDKYKGELKSKNWVGRIYIDGKQKIFSSGTQNLDEAIPILEKWFDDIHEQKAKEKENLETQTEIVNNVNENENNEKKETNENISSEISQELQSESLEGENMMVLYYPSSKNMSNQELTEICTLLISNFGVREIIADNAMIIINYIVLNKTYIRWYNNYRPN